MTDKDHCEDRHRGSETSAAAFKSTSDSTRDKQRAKILSYLSWEGELGATTYEIHQYTGFPYTTCSARMSELRQEGEIHDSGRRRPTNTGRMARVMRFGPPPGQRELF